MIEILPDAIDMISLYWCSKCGRMLIQSIYKKEWKEPEYLGYAKEK
jgi:hypothetical protein